MRANAPGRKRRFRLAHPREPREPQRRPLDLALVRRLWQYTRRYRGHRRALFSLTIARAIQLPLLGWAVGRILAGPITEGDVPGTVRAVLAFVGGVVVTELMFVYRIRYALELGEDIVHDLRTDIFSHLLSMPMGFFSRMPLGRLLSRASSDVEAIRLGIQDAVFVGVVQVGCMLGAACLMLFEDAQLFLVVLGMVPLLWWLLRRFHARLFDAHTAMHESFARVTTTLAATVGGIRVIQGFGREDAARAAFGELVHDHSRYNMKVAEQNAVFAPVLELNGQVFLATLLVIGGWQALTGAVELAALIHFMFLANLFFAPIPILAQQYNQALTAMAGAERVFRLLDTPRDWEDPADARALPPIEGRVEWQNVCFAYQDGIPVLRDVSFTVTPGQTVALVGATGGGKSTILSLTAKLYLPGAGHILIDGHDITQVDRGSLRRQMGFVQQQNFLWSGTVLENVRFSRPDATRADVHAAARALDVLDLLEALPDGLDSQVGERGANLSLGQRQLVCFTRAMLANPRILLLDEATSAIDTLTEARLQKALALLLEGRTSFVVAHRLSTIRNADQILVVADGRIVERGRFAALIAADGPFAALHRRSVAEPARPPTA